MAKIFHAHLHGDCATKYDRLMESDISDTAWSEILLQTPFYLLIPQNCSLRPEYEQTWGINEILPINSTGVKTHRDHFVLDLDIKKLVKRLEDFRNLNISDTEISSRYGISDTRDWKISYRRCSFSNNSNWKSYITSCLYRPFDWRAYCHHDDVVEFPRNEIMNHILSGENLALSTTRSTEIGRGWEHIFCTQNIIQHHTVSMKETNYIFPLYLYPENEEKALGITRRPNLSQPFLNDITDRLGYTPTPEAIFHYIYAIFHSPTYRSRYAEFLKIDFPRVPLTRNDALFRKLAAYGEELVALHLMKSAKLEQSKLPQFVDQSGKSIVDPAHPKYDAKTRSVIINKKGDHFSGVPEAVWNFYVGGYPVCAKWLKDRKGRTLSPADIAHYQQIVVALSETITLMAAIDQATPEFPIE